MSKTKTQNPPIHQETTKPTKSACRLCNEDVWFCYIKGEPTRLDPHPLTLKGEAVALLCNLHTYEVGFGRSMPFRRRAAHIQAGYPMYGHIYSSHHCEVQWQGEAVEKTWGTSLIDNREPFNNEQHERPPF
jgi:hypothetical protein